MLLNFRSRFENLDGQNPKSCSQQLGGYSLVRDKNLDIFSHNEEDTEEKQILTRIFGRSCLALEESSCRVEARAACEEDFA